MDFLFLDCTYHHRLVPSSISLHTLNGSPVLSFSTFITSAPKSAKILPANGPAINDPNSSTLNPSKACLDIKISSFYNLNVTTFFVVSSSITYLGPSFPIPLSFTPPYGIWSGRKIGRAHV